MVLNESSPIDRSLSSVLVAASVGVGTLCPAVAHMLLPYIFIALFFVVLFSLNTLEESPLHVLRHVRVFTWTIVSWQMFIVPAIVTAACVLLSVPPTIVMILLATTTAGSVFASPALVQMAGLNRRLAVRGMIISTFLMPVSLLLFGTINDVLPPDMSFVNYGKQIFIYLLLPLAGSSLFWIIRPRLAKRVETRVVSGMGWGSTIALMIFCCGVMSKIHMGDPSMHSELALYLGIAVAMSIVMYIATGLLFTRFGRCDSLTAGMLVANRNVALSFGLLAEVFPEQVMIYVAVCQFPIFFTPLAIRICQLLQRSYRVQIYNAGKVK